MKLGEIMSKEVLTIEDSASMAFAADTMEGHRIRHLIVLSGGKLAGILSQRDILRTSPSPATSLSRYEMIYLLNRLSAREIMNREVITARPELEAEEAAKIMLEKRIGALPIVDRGEIVGIVTRSDLLRVLCQKSATLLMDNKGNIAAITIGPRDWSNKQARELMDLLLARK